MGWVSIFHQASRRQALALPPRILPVAYLCLGYVNHFYDRPELEAVGWRQRLPLEELLHFDRWGDDGGPKVEGLKRLIRRDQLAAASGAFPTDAQEK